MTPNQYRKRRAMLLVPVRNMHGVDVPHVVAHDHSIWRMTIGRDPRTGISSEVWELLPSLPDMPGEPNEAIG